MHAINSTASAIITNSVEGSPLAASSPKEVLIGLTKSQPNNPPAVPTRRSSFSNAIAGQDQNKKADGVKLTEDEVTKIYQERNPVERLAKLHSLQTKQGNMVHDMILNRYL